MAVLSYAKAMMFTYYINIILMSLSKADSSKRRCGRFNSLTKLLFYVVGRSVCNMYTAKDFAFSVKNHAVAFHRDFYLAVFHALSK